MMERLLLSTTSILSILLFLLGVVLEDWVLVAVAYISHIPNLLLLRYNHE